MHALMKVSPVSMPPAYHIKKGPKASFKGRSGIRTKYLVVILGNKPDIQERVNNTLSYLLV